MNIEYTRTGDYYIPNLKLPEENRPIPTYRTVDMSREQARLKLFSEERFRIDRRNRKCYIFLRMCLHEQTGKELKSMIVREVATG